MMAQLQNVPQLDETYHDPSQQYDQLIQTVETFRDQCGEPLVA